MGSRQEWHKIMRQTIKLENGDGWSVRGREIRGMNKTQVTYRFQDGLGMKNPRSAVFLPYDWNSRNQSKIITAIADLKRLVDERNLSLKDAAKFMLEPVANDQAPSVTNWENIIKDFLDSRSDRRGTTLRDLKTRMRRVLETIAANPKPRDGRTLMKRFAEMHFDNCPAGGQGRKRNLGDVEAFLEYAVKKTGAPQRWLPPDKEFKRTLIGSSTRTSAEALTVPLKEQDLEMLLDGLASNEKHGLRLCVGLVGLFGLRPSELGELTVDDGKLYVGQTKRNMQTLHKPKAPPRRVIAIDLPSLPNEGQRLIAQYDSGIVKFPLAITRAIQRAKEKDEYKEIGDALRQLLQRYWLWQAMEKRTEGLKVYSLRHGYAWRAHRVSKVPYSVTDASALMGHDPNTHLKHYGRWVDEAQLEEATAKFKAGQEVAA